VLIAVAAIGAGNAALFVVSLFAAIGSTAVAWGAMVEARAQKRSRGQLPRRSAPSAGGQAIREQHLPPRLKLRAGRLLRRPTSRNGRQAACGERAGQVIGQGRSRSPADSPQSCRRGLTHVACD